MEQANLLKNIVRLCQWKIHDDSAEQIQALHGEIWQHLDALSTQQMWEVMITRNGLKALIQLDTDKAATIWKHPCIEDFVDTAWCTGFLDKEYDYPSPNKWKDRAYKAGQFVRSCAFRPSLIWASHVFYNLVLFVVLVTYINSPDLLVEFPQPFEIVILVLLLLPSFFPPYNPASLGYITIDVIFIISVSFRIAAYKGWMPTPTYDLIALLLNSRTIVAFLPLIQAANIVLISFLLPSFNVMTRFVYPTFPIAIMLFIGFFVSIHFLADTHNTVRYTFDVLLRTILLDIHPGGVTEYHPVAARILYYLFGFASLYLFWGVGIAGVGMRVARETDWHAERVRLKAIKLLRYLPSRRPIRRKRLLGRGKVVSAMPFNILEGIGVVFRIYWLRDVAIYLGMLPIILEWSLESIARTILFFIWGWMRKLGGCILDEIETEIDSDAEVEDDLIETAPLLS